MLGCVPWVDAPVLLAYATFSARSLRLGALVGVAAASSSRSSAILSLSPCERRQQLKEEQGAPLRARVGGGLERHPKVSQLRVSFKPAPPT